MLSRRLSIYVRVALLVTVLLTATNVGRGVIRFRHESPRVGDMATAAFHAFALTLLPAVLLASLAAVAVTLLLRTPLGRRLGEFLGAPFMEPAPERLASAHANLAALTAFGIVSQQAALHFATKYHDQWLASSALAATLVLALAALAWARETLALGLRALFGKLRFLGTPLVFHLAVAGVVAAFIALFVRASPSLFLAYHPFDLALLPATLAAFAVLALLLSRLSRPLKRGVAPGIVALSLVSLVLSAFVYENRYRHRVWVEERFVVVKRLYRLAAHLTDRDGDGYSFLFGGQDCDDGDPSVHPGAADPPGDGVDSDCFAGDGGPEISTMSRGHFAPSPLGDVKPNILLITVDALRPDHLGCFGYERPTSPTLDTLCKKSVRFHEAVAQSSRSIRSLPSMFTGFSPSQIAYGDEYLFPALLPENKLIAELLSPHYQTAAVLGTNYFQRFTGFNQGFQTFRQDSVYLPARNVVTDWAIEELKRMRRLDRPFFLWTYVFNVHVPYLHDKHPSKFGDRDVDAYDTEITLADAEIARLLEALTELDFQRPTVIVVHSDHGEAFFEHGQSGHSHNTHREEVRSTLFIYVPGMPGRDVHIPVPLADVMPTLANLANIKLRHDIPARSLVPLFTEEPGPEFIDRLIFSEVLPDGQFPWDEKMIQRGTDKLIYDPRSGRVQLYDHTTDPTEHDDLSDDRPALVQELLGLLRSWIAETHRPEQRDDVVVQENRLDALPETMTHPVDVTYGGFLRLVGLDVSKTELRRGDTLELDFYYEVLGETEKDLFFYVDVKTPEGSDAAHDFHARHYPMNGRYRTNRFRKGELLRDPVRLVVPRTLQIPQELTITLMVAHGRSPVPHASARGVMGYSVDLAKIRVK